MRRPASCGWTRSRPSWRIRAVLSIGRREHARPAAEDHPLVGRDVPVVQEVLRVEERPPARRELGDEVVRQRLGGDDVAPDRDDPAPERRCDAVRVAVRGDEHVAGEDRPTLGLDREPAVRLTPHGPRPDALVEVRARHDRPPPRDRRTADPDGRAAARDDEPAVVDVRADLLVETSRGARTSTPRRGRPGSRAAGRGRGRATPHGRARRSRIRGSRSRSSSSAMSRLTVSNAASVSSNSARPIVSPWRLTSWRGPHL